MSTLSTARQIDVEHSRASDHSLTFNSAIDPSEGRRESGFSASVYQLPRFPSFSRSLKAENDASRIAHRVNAGAISDADHKKLLAERQQLLDKELSGSITTQQKNRLAYVRWSLDRVDDARYGDGLDKLENIVRQYERFHDDIEKFRAELGHLQKYRRSYP